MEIGDNERQPSEQARGRIHADLYLFALDAEIGMPGGTVWTPGCGGRCGDGD